MAPIPDLIHDDVLKERADRVTKMALGQGLPGAAPTTLDRVTVFLTHRCNLRCVYCNGPHMDKGIDDKTRREMLDADLTPESYATLLEQWAAHGCHSIHFTGGEPTLHPSLADFVRLAHDKSIPSLLTTNGTAKSETYARIIDAGCGEIRVSIDSTDDSRFDKIVGIPRSAAKVKRAIKDITSLRDQGKDVRLILNACVGSFNIDSLRETVQSLIALDPDDAKLLVVAEDGQAVHDRASRHAVDDLLALVRDKGHMELLETKILSLFRKDTSGLKDRTTRKVMKHCYIPLTERTLDARGIYPCSIYLRYRGSPLSRLEDSFDEQQKAARAFVDDHDCRDDPICAVNCTNCCKRYNIETNKRIRDTLMIRHARQNPIGIGTVNAEDIAAYSLRQEAIEKLAPADKSFLIIKPQGYGFRHEIIEYLAEQGVRVEGQTPISNWQALSMHLYHREGCDVGHRIARSRAHAAVDKGEALLLVFEKGVPHKKLLRIRNQLRQWFGEDERFFHHDGKEHGIKINCIHAPDPDRTVYESKVLAYFLAACVD